MTCGVYEIINKEINQSYIGRSLDIENRWEQHKKYPSDNMLPTIELYDNSPDMVEFNIVQEVETHHFDSEELQFITSVCESYEMERGGVDMLINVKSGHILSCPPSIISKRDWLPECVTVDDLLIGLEKWYWEVYRYHVFHNPLDFKNESLHTDPDSGIYWRKQYLEIKEKYENSQSELKNIPHPLPSEKMKEDYEYFKLKKENTILTDEKEELELKLSFWKEKCHSWREKYFSLSERQCSQYNIKTSAKKK